MRTLGGTVVVLALMATALVGPPALAGEGTEKAQRRLNALGCSAGPVDGRLGPRSRTGVLRFQAANALGQTGSLNESTRRRLYAGRQVRCDRRPVPGGGASGRRIVISQRQNYVWLVRPDGSVAAQSGMVDNPRYLRPGTYRAGSKCGRPGKVRDNSDYSGRLRLQNFVRFAPCGGGFHRIPQYRTSGAQIHPDWMLGTDLKESHGCIRLSRSMSATVWSFASVGTRVVVLG